MDYASFACTIYTNMAEAFVVGLRPGYTLRCVTRMFGSEGLHVRDVDLQFSRINHKMQPQIRDARSKYLEIKTATMLGHDCPAICKSLTVCKHDTPDSTIDHHLCEIIRTPDCSFRTILRYRRVYLLPAVGMIEIP